MTHELYINCNVATMVESPIAYGLINDGAIGVTDGRIAWVGTRKAWPPQFNTIEPQSLDGALVTPALIDCHTHLVYGGNRSAEFELRLKNVPYEEISRAGGGIMSTVKATRNASDEQLISQSLSRLDHLISEGVRIVEIKSGYGLTIDHEMRLLKIARTLETLRPVKIVTTWLAAHALPPQYTDKSDNYIDEIVIPGLIQASKEGLVDAVDGFCEHIGFSKDQMERVFQAARSLNLPVKLHAEQLSDQKGALLAAKYKALSADHLEFLDEDDVKTFAKSGTVAVLLPGAFYFLRETKLPPIDALRAANVPMAIATDCNPGTSPISSLLTIMNMASTLFRLTPEEALAGVTRDAAKALGLHSDYGRVITGAVAELCVWNVDSPAELCTQLGPSPLRRTISTFNTRKSRF